MNGARNRPSFDKLRTIGETGSGRTDRGANPGSYFVGFPNGLTLHPDKTHLGDCRIEGQGFEFLGYRFEAGKHSVRKNSLTALKEKVRAFTQRTRGDSLGRIIADLKPMLNFLRQPGSGAKRVLYNATDIAFCAPMNTLTEREAV